MNYAVRQSRVPKTLSWADIVPKIVNLMANLLKLGNKLATDMGRNYNDTTKFARGLSQGVANQTGLPGDAWPAAANV